MSDHDDPHGADVDLLIEYRAAVARVDDAITAATARAGDALACRAGCASCCVDGLSVLPVEAESIAAYLEEHTPTWQARGGGHCAFLDDEGRCAIYAARPLLCRTHGLALRMRRDGEQPAHAARGLRVLGDDVEACALNYTTRVPQAAEVLDASRILALLTTVDLRFRAAAELSEDDVTDRIALRDLAQS